MADIDLSVYAGKNLLQLTPLLRPKSQEDLQAILSQAEKADPINALLIQKLKQLIKPAGGAGAPAASAAPAAGAGAPAAAANSGTNYGIFKGDFISIIKSHKNAAGIVGEGGSAGGSIVRKISLTSDGSVSQYYVKIMNLKDDLSEKAKIDAEIKISMELTSKLPEYVTKCMGGYTSSRDAYILYEYKEGITLDKVSDQLYRDSSKGAPGGVYNKNAILTSLKGCVSAMHSNGYVHRDLKPDNIFCCLDNSRFTHCILIDFGETQRIGDPPKPIKGGGNPTFHNTAIDAAQSEGVTVAVDLFALAKIAIQRLKIRSSEGDDGGLGFSREELRADDMIAPFLDMPSSQNNNNAAAGGYRRYKKHSKTRKPRNKPSKTRKLHTKHKNRR